MIGVRAGPSALGRLREHARVPVTALVVPARQRRLGGDLAWDVVLLFPPGVRRETELPWPSYADGPVVTVGDELSRRLSN